MVLLPEHAWVQNLLDWYHANKRQMPWRGHPDPYAVWVSEIMLQQTQVDTVRPYFVRFMESFPTLQALAEATDDVLLKSWEGLGYYTRVRNLRKAAQTVIAHFHGQLPQTAAQLQTLPGIGAYTAAAIASIAFGEAIPVVDGNVARVFSRYRCLEDNFKKDAPRRDLATWLTPFIQAVPSSGDFNQAMMELGALVCTPRNPTCESCPLRETCKAAEAGMQAEYPKIEKAKTLPTRKFRVALLQNDAGEILLAQSREERLLAGFWELPHIDQLTLPKPKRPQRLGVYKQTFSHFHLELTVLSWHVEATPPLPATQQWVALPTPLPLTTATRKILDLYLPSKETR